VAAWDPVNITSKGNRSRVEFGSPSPTLHERGMSVVANSLRAQSNAASHRADHDTYGVRRLTPLETMRLQGFPDWWYDGLGMADSHIYRQMGNAVAVPVAEWLGHRLTAVEGNR
jgi:site-specific DNA-cytosine methylase